MMLRAETRSISIPAPPSVVHAYVADGGRLPEWAPDFAPEVRPEGDDWRVVREDGDALVSLVADAARGTVDIVNAADHSQGAFVRALPNGDGSELLFTVMLPADLPDAAVEQQLATIDAELATVRDACAM